VVALPPKRPNQLRSHPQASPIARIMSHGPREWRPMGMARGMTNEAGLGEPHLTRRGVGRCHDSKAVGGTDMRVTAPLPLRTLAGIVPGRRTHVKARRRGRQTHLVAPHTQLAPGLRRRRRRCRRRRAASLGGRS
jgi:hypothetical protein